MTGPVVPTLVELASRTIVRNKVAFAGKSKIEFSNLAFSYDRTFFFLAADELPEHIVERLSRPKFCSECRCDAKNRLSPFFDGYATAVR